jgi:hypothetical protein
MKEKLLGNNTNNQNTIARRHNIFNGMCFKLLIKKNFSNCRQFLLKNFGTLLFFFLFFFFLEPLYYITFIVVNKVIKTL